MLEQAIAAGLGRSGEEFLDEVAVDVRQAIVAPLELVRQTGVVDTEAVQQRRVQVMDALGYGVEGVMVLTNSGTIAEGRVPNNALDHVEDANSNHSNGVNFLFGDGSVRSIQNTISPEVWVGMTTRAGGEVFDPDY
jgi:prepilin-type processing-associated H-X9-DG protein